jgi:hypothetical protein
MMLGAMWGMFAAAQRWQATAGRAVSAAPEIHLSLRERSARSAG